MLADILPGGPPDLSEVGNSAPPLVAVDANPATRPHITGTERLARELARRLPVLAPDLRWALFTSRAAPGLAFDATVLPLPRLWSQVRLPLQLWRARPALTLVPAHVVPFLAPGAALAVVHDLAFERFPGAYGPGQLAYLRATTRWAELRCRRLLAVSEATKRDLVELHGVAPEQVDVIHPGGGEEGAEADRAGPSGEKVGEERLAGLGVARPYVLTVGRIERRKNQETALAAVRRRPGLQLVLAGPIRDPGMADGLAAAPGCRLLGPVAQSDLDLLYSQAEALVVPSLYEGFGFPLLEAMRIGLPVVCGRVSSLPEVGGDAPEYVNDPRDPTALAGALSRVLDDPARREQMAERGRRQAARFTWARCAEEVLAVIRSLLAR